MEQEIANLFPNGVRALVVDDDATLLTPSSMMLRTLNFKVDTCSSVASALKLINEKNIKDVDAILINVEKAAECNFDFRGVVESNMRIPVVYYLPPDHEATCDEAADELLHTRALRPAGTNDTTVKKPVDANQVCDLWRAIACRKCTLEAKAENQQAGGGRVLPAAVMEALLAGGTGRKRKSSRNPVVGSSGNQAAMRQQQIINLTGGQERENLVSLQLQERRGMEARKKNNGKAPMFQQPRAICMDGQLSGQQQQSLFVQSALRTLDVPPYNPRIYADTAGLSDNAGASAGDRPPLMLRPFSASHQGPPPRIVQEPGDGMRRHETGSIMLNFQQPGDLFTGMASGSVTTFGASAAATAHVGAYGNPARPLLQSLSLGTDNHDELSAMVTMHNGSSSNPPVAPPPPQHVGVASNQAAMEALYDNNYCYRSLMAPRRIGHHVEANQKAAMGMLDSDGYIDYSTASAMAPLQADHGVTAGMEEEALYTNNYSNYSSESALAPDHQVLGTASNVNELTISGGALFGDNSAASFTASQNLVAAAPNGDQLAPGALDDDDDLIGWAMGSHDGPGTAMDGNAGFAAMSPADHYAGNTISLEELLGPDGQQGGATDGAAAAAAAAAAAGTSLIGGGSGNGTLDIGAAYNLDGDFFLGDLWDFRPQPYDVNNGRK